VSKHKDPRNESICHFSTSKGIIILAALVLNVAKSFLETSQESRKWLIFSTTQLHCVPISSTLSPQTACQT